MDSFLGRAQALGCDGVSLESCFFPEFGAQCLTGLPTILYGALLWRQKFPVSERVAAGVSYRDMLADFGALGAFVATDLTQHDAKNQATLAASFLGAAKGSVFGVYRALDQDKLKAAPEADQKAIETVQAGAKKNALTTAADVAGQFHLWWLGQSGFLLKWNGRAVLFDPCLSDSLTEKYAGTDKEHIRTTRRPVVPERLGFVDVVAASHAHTDHLDGETLVAVARAAQAARRCRWYFPPPCKPRQRKGSPACRWNFTASTPAAA